MAQQWQFIEFTGSNGVQEAVNFLNAPARQGPGETSATLQAGGSVGLFYLEPGSLGSSTAQTWERANFTGMNGAQLAVNFLNESARQGPGQVTAAMSVGGPTEVIYLSPGSLGSNTTPSWETLVEPGPVLETTLKSAVNFLNENPRQGPGEVSVTVLPNGSVGLIFLNPGSLGALTSPTWFFKEFPAPNGVTSALAFLNATPQQAAGEVSAFAPGDGSAVIVYLEPGPN
jgi:hypothetical protein